MTRISRLHVPRPPARPGQAPDFSYLQISPAGELARPEVTAAFTDTEFLASGMVRVLDEQHRAVGPWNPHLEPDELQVGLRHMLLTRLFDQRMQTIQRQGRISFYLRSLGEEAVSIAQCMALRPVDMLFPGYRNQGLHIARGHSLVEVQKHQEREAEAQRQQEDVSVVAVTLDCALPASDETWRWAALAPARSAEELHERETSSF